MTKIKTLRAGRAEGNHWHSKGASRTYFYFLVILGSLQLLCSAEINKSKKHLGRSPLKKRQHLSVTALLLFDVALCGMLLYGVPAIV